VVGRFQGTVVVTLHGDVDEDASAALARVLVDLVDGQGNLDVALDLDDVDAIDASGLQALSAAASTIFGRGGELRVACPSGAVWDALLLAGLAYLIIAPLHQVSRRWPPGSQNRSASIRAAIDAHPAGNGWRHPNHKQTPGEPLRPHQGWEAAAGHRHPHGLEDR